MAKLFALEDFKILNDVAHVTTINNYSGALKTFKIKDLDAFDLVSYCKHNNICMDRYNNDNNYNILESGADKDYRIQFEGLENMRNIPTYQKNRYNILEIIYRLKVFIDGIQHIEPLTTTNNYQYFTKRMYLRNIYREYLLIRRKHDISKDIYKLYPNLNKQVYKHILKYIR